MRQEKEEDKEGNGKGTYGMFSICSWKMLALDRERFRCKVKDATSNSSKAFSPPP